MPNYKYLKRLITDAAYFNSVNLEDRCFDWCAKLQVMPNFSSSSRRIDQSSDSQQSRAPISFKSNSGISLQGAGKKRINYSGDFQFKSYAAVRLLIH